MLREKTAVFSFLMACLILSWPCVWVSQLDAVCVIAQEQAGQVVVKEVEDGVERFGSEFAFAEVGPITDFDICPTSDTIAFTTGGTVKLWDLEKGKVTDELKDTAGFNGIKYSGDGMQLFGWGYIDGKSKVLVFDAISKSLIRTINPADDLPESETGQFYIQRFVVSPDDQWIAISDQSLRTFIYEVESGELLSQVKHKNYVRGLVFTADGKQLVDSSGHIYDVATGKKAGDIPGGSGFGGQRYFQSVQISPKDNRLVAAQWGQQPMYIDLDDKQEIELEIKGSVSGMFFEFSGNGKMLAGVSSDNSTDTKLHIWDAKTGRLKFLKKKLSPGYQPRLCFANDNESVFIKFQADNRVQEIELDEDDANMVWHTGAIKEIGFVDDERVFGVSNSRLLLHDLKSGEASRLHGQQSLSHVVISPKADGKIATASTYEIKLVNADSGKAKSVNFSYYRRRGVLSGLRNILVGRASGQNYEYSQINSIVADKDGKIFSVASRSNRSCDVARYRLSNGKLVKQKRFKLADYFPEAKSDEDQPEGAPSRLPNSQLNNQSNSATVSGDGKYLAIAGNTGNVVLIDIEDKSLVHEFDGFEDVFSSGFNISFTPDGDQLLIKAGSRLSAYDVETGEENYSVKVNATRQAKYSYDAAGERLVTNDTNKIYVLDVESGDTILERKVKHFGGGVGLSPSGEKVAVGLTTGQYEIWDLNTVKSK